MPTTGTMTWLGHSAIRLTLPDGRVVLIDPWLRDNPSCPPALKNAPRCDFLALTHAHFDHAGDAQRIIEQHNPHVVAIVELCTVLGMKNPHGRFSPMNLGGTQVLDGVSFTLTRAFHTTSIDTPAGPIYCGVPAGVIAGVEGLASFYHAGDTDVFSDMTLIAEMFAPRVAALPIGDHFTMGPRGAALAAKYIRPQSIVPIHFATFPILRGTVEAFREALPADMKDRLIAPKVGQDVVWTFEGLSAD